VDVRRVVRRDGAGPVHSTIIVEEGRGTRTIFNDSSRVLGADPERPPRRFIESARVLLVDRFGMPGMIRAARMAREAGIPVVADFESSRTPGFAELLGLVDHLILSSDFASALTGAVAPSAAAGALWREGRSVVVVTWGDAGCWAVDGPGAPARHIPAFKVKAVDTTGCGDVFRGAYAAALARGLGLEERLRFASAAAALKATRRGGQAGIPRLPEVRGLLKGRAR
jgi:ribokinase